MKSVTTCPTSRHCEIFPQRLKPVIMLAGIAARLNSLLKKVLMEGEDGENHPPGAEAHVDVLDFCGTAEQLAEKVLMEGEDGENHPPGG